MSKITIVEGDILETIGGNDLSFAKKEIINSGSKVIQVGKETGVSYGEPSLNNRSDIPLLMDVIAKFERGTNYKGEYGFDWLEWEVVDWNDAKKGNTITKYCNNDIANFEYYFDETYIDVISKKKGKYAGVTTNEVRNKIKDPYKKGDGLFEYVNRFEYYSAWLNLLPYNELPNNLQQNGITLRLVIVKTKSTINEPNMQEFLTVQCSTNNLSISSDDLKENIYNTQEGIRKIIPQCIKVIGDKTSINLTIKYNQNALTVPKNTIITITDQRGNIVGKLNILDNERISILPVRLVALVDKNSRNLQRSISNLYNTVNPNNLETELNQRFVNQSLIQIRLERNASNIVQQYYLEYDKTDNNKRIAPLNPNNDPNIKPSTAWSEYFNGNYFLEDSNVTPKMMSGDKLQEELDNGGLKTVGGGNAIGDNFRGKYIFITELELQQTNAGTTLGFSYVLPACSNINVILKQGLANIRTFAHEALGHSLGLLHNFSDPNTEQSKNIEAYNSSIDNIDTYSKNITITRQNNYKHLPQETKDTISAKEDLKAIDDSVADLRKNQNLNDILNKKRNKEALTQEEQKVLDKNTELGNQKDNLRAKYMDDPSIEEKLPADVKEELKKYKQERMISLLGKTLIENQKYFFKKGTSENVMDYNNTPNAFAYTKIQWLQMREEASIS